MDDLNITNKPIYHTTVKMFVTNAGSQILLFTDFGTPMPKKYTSS